MRIGELARSVDVNSETIRYYQRIGLLTVPEKPYGGMRSYGDEDLQRLRFIRRAQQLGFSLEDIRELLELSSSDCERVEKLALETDAKVDFDKKTASISFDPEKANLAALTKATADAGYPSSVQK